MMNYPLITIGIPTFNRANGFLKDAILSALNQTYPNIEIIISDNCSSDNTEELVKSFEDHRIRYFKHPENIGANNNFNFCVNKAKGAYFLLLCDDDLIDMDFIEVCLKAVDYNTDIGIIRTGTRIIDAEGKILSQHDNLAEGNSIIDFITSWFSNKTSLYLCSTLFNTQYLQEMGGFSSKWNLFQDVIAEVKLAAKYGRVEVKEIKSSFRKHPDERTFIKKIDKWCEDSLQLIDVMCTLAPEHKQYIKNEGMKFLSRINYNFARKNDSPLKRFISYLIIFKSFNFKVLPPPVKNKFQSLNGRIQKLMSS